MDKVKKSIVVDQEVSKDAGTYDYIIVRAG